MLFIYVYIIYEKMHRTFFWGPHRCFGFPLGLGPLFRPGLPPDRLLGAPERPRPPTEATRAAQDCQQKS